MAAPDANTNAPDRDAEAHRLRALDRLRDRVETAVREIERLRAENAELTARVRDLEATAGDADVVGLAFDEEPEALRAKIEGFIEAIDRLLAEPADEPPASS